MTCVERFTRNPSQIEAVCLDRPAALHAAEVWLRGHGIKVAIAHPTLIGRALVVPGPGGFVARLGQWLVHDVTADTWSAVDDRLITSPLFTPHVAQVLPLAGRR